MNEEANNILIESSNPNLNNQLNIKIQSANNHFAKLLKTKEGNYFILNIVNIISI